MNHHGLGASTLLGVCLLATQLSGCPSGPSSAPSPSSGSAPLPSSATVKRNPTTEAIERVEGADLSEAIALDPGFSELRRQEDYAGMALAFLDHYKREFRLRSPTEELQVARINGDALGYHQVRLRQTHRDLPVVDAELIVHFDPQDRIYLVQGHYLTAGGNTTEPALSSEDARRSLIAEIGAEFAIAGGDLVVMLPMGMAQPIWAYQFEVQRGRLERREILVDALTGRKLRDLPIVINAH